MKTDYTQQAQNAILYAGKIGKKNKHNYIGTEHILYGLVKEGEGIASKVLTNKGLTEEKIKNKMHLTLLFLIAI